MVTDAEEFIQAHKPLRSGSCILEDLGTYIRRLIIELLSINGCAKTSQE